MIKVSEKVFETRINICKGCEKLLKPSMMCGVCFCFLNVKASLKFAECPIKKWEKDI